MTEQQRLNHPTTPYDTLWEEYESAPNKQFYQTITDLLINNCEDLNPLRGLDLACGVGFSTECLLKEFPSCQWHAVDSSLPMIVAATHRMKKASVFMVAARAEALPYPTESFDVICCNVGCHWFERQSWHEVFRILRPKGTLLLSVPVANSVPGREGNQWIRHGIWRTRRNFVRRLAQGVKPEKLQSLLTGWTIDRIESATIEETLSSPGELFRVLRSRGALHALFGSEATAMEALMSHSGNLPEQPISFQWNLSLVVARKP